MVLLRSKIQRNSNACARSNCGSIRKGTWVNWKTKSKHRQIKSWQKYFIFILGFRTRKCALDNIPSRLPTCWNFEELSANKTSLWVQLNFFSFLTRQQTIWEKCPARCFTLLWSGSSPAWAVWASCSFGLWTSCSCPRLCGFRSRSTGPSSGRCVECGLRWPATRPNCLPNDDIHVGVDLREPHQPPTYSCSIGACVCCRGSGVVSRWAWNGSSRRGPCWSSVQLGLGLGQSLLSHSLALVSKLAKSDPQNRLLSQHEVCN